VNDDRLFRLILLAGFVVFMPIGIYHRLKARTGEKLDRRQEGLFILATLRPLGAAFWSGLITWMISPAWMSWSAMPIPAWLRWTGVGVVIAAVGLLVWTFRTLGSNLTDTVVTRQNHTLVVHGPYRWVRHPFYDCAALLTTGISLASANWFLLGTGITVMALLIIRTRIEERNLLARFGGEYQAYMERTGRFLPRLSDRHAAT
jgi:protein-S-isoprenylcysteine O-methyltransferase Ste14